MIRFALDRNALQKIDGVNFSKFLGCGKGISFTPLDADFHRWCILVCVDESFPNALNDLDNSLLIKKWRRFANEEFRVVLGVTSSHGKWSGKDPFAPAHMENSDGGQVAAITRARVSLVKYPQFLRAIPKVARELHSASGLICAIGIGEAPIGLQGTFSMWESAEDLQNFAFKGKAHSKAITDTSKFGWYKEELFARFSIEKIHGAL